MPVSSGSPAPFQAAVPPASTRTGARHRGDLGGGIAGDGTVSLVSTRSPWAGNFASGGGEARADREPCAGDVAVAMAAAQRQVDDDRGVRGVRGGDGRRLGPASGRYRCGWSAACRFRAPPLEHRGREPRRPNPCAGATRRSSAPGRRCRRPARRARPKSRANCRFPGPTARRAPSASPADGRRGIRPGRGHRADRACAGRLRAASASVARSMRGTP